MQTVSTTFQTALRTSAKKLVPVIEIYKSDAVPASDGFDPASTDCLKRFAMVANITFRGVSYERLLLDVGKVSKKFGKQLNDFDFTLSNMSRAIADFEIATGFEGLVCVYRLIDWNVSSVLADSLVEFSGRCEAPDEFNRGSEKVKIGVKQILNQTDVVVPRRTFSPNDDAGRVPSDTLFEGFRIQHRTGQFTYQIKRSFLFIFKKKEKKYVQYSSHSDFSSNQSVPLILGRVQAEMIHLAYEDIGAGIAGLGAWADGNDQGIKGYENIRSESPGLPLDATADKTGELGGTGDQINDDPGWVGAGIYSRTAYSRYFASGSPLDREDPAPVIVSIVFGQLMPLPDSSGDFTIVDFSVNPVYQARWLMNSGLFFNLADEWFDDAEIIESANYCDQILTDVSNSEIVNYSNDQTGFAGVNYFNYKSTGAIDYRFFLSRSDATQNKSAAFLEVQYKFYSDYPDLIDDFDGDGVPDYASYGDIPTQYRRRSTSNIRLAEEESGLDFLFDTLFPAANLFLTQKANGKIAVKVKKPKPCSFMFAQAVATDTAVKVRSILAWKDLTNPKVLIGAYLATSEVRTVTGVRFSTAETINISASGGVSSSSTTLTGGSTTLPPNATLTVSSASGTKTVTIDGYVLTFAPHASDTTATAAGMIAAQINSHPILTRYIRGVWVAGASTVKVESKIGFLDLDAAIENTHETQLADPTTAPTLNQTAGALAAGDYEVCYSYQTLEGETLCSSVASITLTANKKIDISSITPPARAVFVNWYVSQEPGGLRRKLINQNDGSGFSINALPDLNQRLEPFENSTHGEVMLIAMAFADTADATNQLTRSNMLRGSFKYPLGKKQKSVNQVRGKFRDAAQDFRLTELIVNDTAHQAKVKKINKEEINLAAVDSENQARRLLNQYLAEQRDGDFFTGFSAEGEALLLEEGDVIAVTDESGRFHNEPVRVEDIDFELKGSIPTISLTARKYRRYFYDDQVREKITPLPIVANDLPNTETVAPVIWKASPATNTSVSVGANNFTSNARYRKIEFSSNSDMSSATETVINQYPMEELSVVAKTGEASAVTRYIRVSHSSNNVTYSPVSNILAVTFADSGGGGGDPIEPDPCFTGKMPFRLWSGETIDFEDLYNRRDQFINTLSAKSYDENGKGFAGIIEEVFCHEVTEYLEVCFESGELHEVTKNHRYYTAGQYKAIGEFKKGQSIQGDRIIDIKRVKTRRPVKVYNARIRGFHNYTLGNKHVSNIKYHEF